MRIGLQVPRFTWPGGNAEIGARLAQIGRAADEAGFYSLWVMDHFFQIRGVGEYTEPMLEGYSALNYLAGVTRQVKLGTMVTGVVYRHPGILVKTVTTLDVLSGGRAYLGIGAAWNEQEARALGVPFPPLKERFERLEEALQIALQMWSGDTASFQGRHYQLGEPLNRPQPIQKPHPPILVGGTGEQKTLRLVAKYADGCNLFARMGNEVLQHKLDVLRRHCDELDRPYDDIEKTALDSIPAGSLDPKQLIAHCQNLARMGFSHLIVSLGDVQELKGLERIGREVIPEVAGL